MAKRIKEKKLLEKYKDGIITKIEEEGITNQKFKQLLQRVITIFLQMKETGMEQDQIRISTSGEDKVHCLNKTRTDCKSFCHFPGQEGLYSKSERGTYRMTS